MKQELTTGGRLLGSDTYWLCKIGPFFFRMGIITSLLFGSGELPSESCCKSSSIFSFSFWCCSFSTQWLERKSVKREMENMFLFKVHISFWSAESLGLCEACARQKHKADLVD